MTDYSKLSDEELQAIIDKGPQPSQQPQQEQSAAPDYSKLSDDELQAIIDKGPQQQSQDNRSFYQRNVKPFALEVAKGVPIAGAFVPQTPDMTDFEQRHPYVARGANIGGSAAGTAAAALAAPEAFGLGVATPWALRLLGGVGTNAVMNREDALLRGKSEEEANKAALIGGLGGAIPGMTTLGPKTTALLADKIVPWGATGAAVAHSLHSGSVGEALMALGGGHFAKPTLSEATRRIVSSGYGANPASLAGYDALHKAVSGQ